MAHVQARIAETDYAVSLTARRHTWVGDEPHSSGGQDTGPAPYDLLLASLGACTAITLRMYAKRKHWEVRSVLVELRFERGENSAHIDRVVTIEGDVNEEQRARMMEIAEKTPVTLTLRAGTDIRTRLQSTR